MSRSEQKGGVVSHPLVELARQTLQETIVHRRPFHAPADLVQQYSAPAAVFVTLWTADGALRGCIGSVVPTTASLAEEVVAESVAAATRDPRFRPVTPGEAPALRVEISVLSEPEPVDSAADLNPARFGVIVASARDGRRGLLLPNIAGIETPARQIALARRKAQIGEDEPIRLFRFRTDKYD